MSPRRPGTGPMEDGVPTRRNKRRYNLVRRSAHRDEYDRLIRAGWSSYSLERYALYRYSEDIPHSTFARHIRRVLGPDLGKRVTEVERLTVDPHDPDQLVDVLAMRVELIYLQRERVAMEVKRERDSGELLPTTRAEITLLNAMLTAVKEDMQDLGMVPRTGQVINVQHSGEPDPARVPRFRTLADALGDSRPDVEMQVARMLHDALPAELDGSGDGQVIEGEVS